MADTQPLAPTDAEIIALLRPLYASDEAASMGAADDLRTARAVLAKWGAQPVPAGYALVPVEPTPEMLSVMWVPANSSLADAYSSLSDAYNAMLAAAPQPVVREPRYRLLEPGIDRIEADDEFLMDDTQTWETDAGGIFVGTLYGCALRPARRAVERAHGITTTGRKDAP